MSVVRQLAQAVLGLALLGHVVRLLAAAVNDDKPHADPEPAPAGARDPGPTCVRDQRGGMVPGGDVGGDAQLDESFSVRFWHRHRPGALVGYSYYAHARPGRPGHRLRGAAHRAAGLHRPEDPGSTEVWSDYRYEAVRRGFGSVEAATAAAKRAAEAHLTCDEAWSGLPPWESNSEGSL